VFLNHENRCHLVLQVPQVQQNYYPSISNKFTIDSLITDKVTYSVDILLLIDGVIVSVELEELEELDASDSHELEHCI